MNNQKVLLLLLLGLMSIATHLNAAVPKHYVLPKAYDTLKVAMFLEPPFVDDVNGKLVGENISISRLLADSVNLKVQFLRCPFARCMSLMKSGRADLIIGLRKTPKREQYLTFLTPPYRIQHYPLRFYTKRGSGVTIKNYQDLKPLSIGIMRGATYFDQFDNDKTLNKVELTSRIQLVNMLLRGRIDTFLEREESILPLLPYSQYKKEFVLADYVYDHAVESYIAISKKTPINNYAEQLSTNLAQFIQDGTIETIMNTRPDVFGEQP